MKILLYWEGLFPLLFLSLPSSPMLTPWKLFFCSSAEEQGAGS